MVVIPEAQPLEDVEGAKSARNGKHKEGEVWMMAVRSCRRTEAKRWMEGRKEIAVQTQLNRLVGGLGSDVRRVARLR